MNFFNLHLKEVFLFYFSSFYLFIFSLILYLIHTIFILYQKLTHIESYVIDFFVEDNDDIMVIELNPFHQGLFFFSIPSSLFFISLTQISTTGAGACLFSWREDRETFMNGPYTFRVVTEDAKQTDPVSVLPGTIIIILFFFFFFSEMLFTLFLFLGFWSRNLSPYMAQKKKEEGGNGEEDDEEEGISAPKIAILGACVALTLSVLYFN